MCKNMMGGYHRGLGEKLIKSQPMKFVTNIRIALKKEADVTMLHEENEIT